MYAASIYIKHHARTVLMVRPTLTMLKHDFASLYGNGREAHWRFADESGWIDGSEGAWKWCPPVEAQRFDFVDVAFHKRF